MSRPPGPPRLLPDPRSKRGPERTSGRPSRGTLWLFVGCLVFALIVAGWQGWMQYDKRNPTPDQTAGIRQTVTVGGATFRVDDFLVQQEFPAQEAGDPPVRAPDGAKIILVLFTTEIIDDSVDPKTHYCEATLVDPDGRVWRTESDISWKVKRPEALTCTGTADQDILRHQPLQLAFSFIVPDDVADDVSLWIQLGSLQDTIIKFTR